MLDGGDLYEGGVPCVEGGELEDEPDDDPTTASPLRLPTSHPTRCGAVLLNGDGGTADPDWVTFTLDSGTTTFDLQWAGNVTLTVQVDGSAPVSSPFDAGIPFNRKDPYYVEIRSPDGKKQFWRVTLFQN
jgi:hypothetical protein